MELDKLVVEQQHEVLAYGADTGSDHHKLPATDPSYQKLDEDWYDRAEILSTDPAIGLSNAEVANRLARFGENVLDVEKDDMCKELLREFFLEPMPVVVWIAILIEVIQAIRKMPGEEGRTSLIDVGVLLLLQFLNVFVAFFEELNAKESIDALQDSLPSQATVVREAQQMSVSITQLVPGDIVHMMGGEVVPADLQVLPKNKPFRVDASAMTGESKLVTVNVGDVTQMGTTIVSGEPCGIVVRTGAKTSIGSMSKMMHGADELGHFERVLQRLLIFLSTAGAVVTLIVFLFLMVGPPEKGFGDTLGFCVVLLIASIPIALKVVCTVTLSLGANELAADGAIVSNLNAIEVLAGLTMLCSDKTGTLTEGKMQLKLEWDLADPEQLSAFNSLEADHPSRGGYHRVFAPGHTRQSLIELAVLCTKWHKWDKGEDASNNFDAIDTMLLQSQEIDKAALSRRFQFGVTVDGSIDFDPFDSAVRLTKCQIRNVETGETFRIAKGATKQILDLCENSDTIRAEYNSAIDAFALRGIRALAMAKSDETAVDENGCEQGWYMAGLLTFLDPNRPDSAHVIKTANKFGVQVKMITGDAHPIAVETCKTLGMGHNILVGSEHLKIDSVEEMMGDKLLHQKYGERCSQSDGFAQVLPEHKYLIVQTFRQMGHLVGMCGDGVNDAPALKKADVGIAVSGAKAAAQKAADIVLTREGLGTIVKAMVISRKIFTRMQNFVIYRVACTEQLLFFFLISSLCYNPHDDYMPQDWELRGQSEEDWQKYFGLPVIALVTITILNDGTIISVAYDNVEASLKPQAWDLKILYWTSSVIGLTALISSVILLQLGLEGADGNGGLCAFGIGAMDYGEIQTMMYLKISLSDYSSVFNSRTKSWCWSRSPSRIVVGAAVFAVAAATFLSKFWPFQAGMKSIEWNVIAFVWVYVIIWSFIQDAAKVLNYQLLHHLKLVVDLGVIDQNYEQSYEEIPNLGPPISGADEFVRSIKDHGDTQERERSNSRFRESSIKSQP